MDSSGENKPNEKENNNNNPPIIPPIDPILAEIQELLTDQDMIQKKLIEQNDDNYILELIFPGGITLKNYDIKFLLIISKEYPKKEPELYCITIFSHPHLCDGRNLLNNIINTNWNNKKYPLDFIINKIPRFIIKCDDYINNKNLILGKYVLDNIYQIEFLKNLPIFFHLIPEINKIITISDISLCLFDIIDNFKFCKLNFFLNIKDIINIELKEKNNLIIIKYNINEKENKINILTQNYETINALLKEKMKFYEKKIGKLPDIDINKLEKEIEKKEKEINNNTMNVEECLILMNLYQEAVEYYSAINNPKFRDMTIKIHKLLESTNLENTNIKNKVNENKDNNDKNDNIVKNVIVINPKDNKQENENKINKEEEKKEIDKKENKEKIKEEKIKEEKIEEKKEGKVDIKKENKSLDKEIKKKEEIKENKEKNDNKKEEKVQNKEEIKAIKEIKKDDKKNENDSLRLKIDEGDINTLDVGEDDEDDEEEEDK